MNIRTRLAQLAGARSDVLAQAPGDLSKHAAMGGVLLSTAMVAGFSAFFALHSTLGLAWAPSVLVGAGWAVVVLNLDRMLVISMNGMRGARLKIAAAIPRLLLAVVIGSVISTPLVLRIFQPEIDAQLTVMHAQQIAQYNTDLNRTYADIGQLQGQETQLENEIAGQSTMAVSQNPDVKQAQTQYDNAENAYEQANAQAECEYDGTCGTGHAGAGGSYKQKEAAAQNAEQVRDQAKTNLDQVTARVTQQVQQGQQSQAAAARQQLPQVQSQLTVAQARRAAAQTQATQADNNDTGLLARLEALEQLTSGQPMAALAHLMLFLLFMFVELLPVVTKLLSSLGDASLYDRLAARQDNEADERDRRLADVERRIVEENTNAKLAIAQEQANAQIAAGKAASKALVDKQTKIALDAIAVWGEVAKLHSDRQLDEWYRAHIDQPDDRLSVAGDQHTGVPSPLDNGWSANELTAPIPRIELAPPA